MPEITSQFPPQQAASRTLPLLGYADHGLAVARWQNAPVTRETFLLHVQRVAEDLSDRHFVINLCQNRYLFLVAFAAVITAGKTNLLPPSRVGGQVSEVAGAYPDHQIVTDTDIEAAIRNIAGSHNTQIPQIAVDQLAALVFTSGSTGRAQAHPKYWSSLVEGARMADACFGFGHDAPTTVVATVPSQHMYGLETSILVPLVCGTGIHAGQPFYAEDICAALAEAAGRRILITTPVHLRVCVESAMKWPTVEFIISATAPLSTALAARAERIFNCPVLEIYGCTEAGSIASRQTTKGSQWQTYDGLSVIRKGTRFEVQGGHLRESVSLNDRLILHDANHFELAGRCADMVNVAGKRASLSNLTLKLSEVDGVEDGVFLQPLDDTGSERTTRLIALVVAPGLGEKQILKRLAECMDPAFLPRPLYRVDRLPRNDLGKLPRDELLKLVRRLQQAKHDG